jgi:hypothetical protein
MPFSGALSTIASFYRSVAGSLGTMSGTVGKKTSKAFSGALGTLSGTLSKQLVDVQELAGNLPAMSGSLTRVKNFTTSLSGSFGMSGALSRKTYYSVAGSLSFAAGNLDAVSGEEYSQSVAGALPAMSGSVSTMHTVGTFQPKRKSRFWYMLFKS